MKKIFTATLVILLYCYIVILSTRPVYAVCNPPSDYQGCPVAQSGPFIAANTDPKNYTQIRNQYNAANPQIKNQLIPVTVIYTTADLANPTWLKNNLEAMKAAGLQPVIRIASSSFGAGGWGQISPQEAQKAAQNLNQALSVAGFAQKPVVYFGNEPNLKQEWGGNPDPNSYAKSFAAFIEGAGSDPSFQIYATPVAGHQGGAEFNYLETVLSYKLSNDKTIAESIQGAAITVYDSDPAKMAEIQRQYEEFYAKYGIENIAIVELGPLVGGQLLQKPKDMARWRQIMSQVFQALKSRPDLLGDNDVITTAFFLDKNNDNQPDTILLVIIDKDGNVSIMELLIIGGGALTQIELADFEPVANGDWFKIKLGPIPGEHDEVPEGILPEIAVDSRSGHEPEPYNDLVALTKMLAGTDKDNETKLEDWGVWERLRIPEESKINPNEQFPELEGRNLRNYFDCVGEEEGYSTVELDKNLGQTRGVLTDLTTRLARMFKLETTNWTQDYELKNEECVKRAEGDEGRTKITSAEGVARILSPAGFNGYFEAVKEQVCPNEFFCYWVTTFYYLVQPKTLPDNITATIPELAYTYSKKQEKGSEEIKRFGGGIFRIFFPPEMRNFGEKERKLYEGEPIDGKGYQDYYSPNGWETYIADDPGAHVGAPAVDVPDDAYGLGGVKAAWNFVQKALGAKEVAAETFGYTSTGLFWGSLSGSDSLDFCIDYMNPNINVSDPTGIQTMISRSWPGANLNRWDEVIQRSRENGINPAFSIAIWIEEGGGGGLVSGEGGRTYRANSEFGCFPGGNTDLKLSFDQSFNCFLNFTAKERPNNFTDWVRYFCGPKADPICSNNPGFLRRIKSIYSQVVPPDSPGALTSGKCP